MQRFFAPSEYQPEPSSTLDSRVTSSSITGDDTSTMGNTPESSKKMALSSWLLRKSSWMRKRDDNYMMLTEDHTKHHKTYVFHDEVEMSTTSADYDRLGMIETQIESGNSIRKNSNTIFDQTGVNNCSGDDEMSNIRLEIPTRRRKTDRKNKDMVHRRHCAATPINNIPFQQRPDKPKSPLPPITCASGSLRRSVSWQIPPLVNNDRLQRTTTTASNYNRRLQQANVQAFPDRRTSRNYHEDPFIQARLHNLLQNEKVMQISKLMHEKRSK